MSIIVHAPPPEKSTGASINRHGVIEKDSIGGLFGMISFISSKLKKKKQA